MFASAEKFDEWFTLGSASKEAEAEVVQQLHKVRVYATMSSMRRGYAVCAKPQSCAAWRLLLSCSANMSTQISLTICCALTAFVTPKWTPK